MSAINKDLVPLTKVLQTSDQQLKNEWCRQLLYKLNIIHNSFENAQCDICLNNLKVDSKNNLVLVNVSEKPTINREIPENVKFKAPELIGNNNTSKEGDIWATGICLFFIKNLSFPWKIAASNDHNFYSWANEGIFPSILNDSYSQVVKQMLCVQPQLRPSIKGVIKNTHSFDTDPNILSEFFYLNKYLTSLIIFYKQL